MIRLILASREERVAESAAAGGLIERPASASGLRESNGRIDGSASIVNSLIARIVIPACTNVRIIE